MPTVGGELQELVQAASNLGSIQYAVYFRPDVNGATIGEP